MPEHPLDAGAREDARLDPHLGRQAAVRPAADARRTRPRCSRARRACRRRPGPAGERARDPLEQPDGAQVRPQVEPLPELEDQPPERDRGRAPTGRRPRPSAPRRDPGGSSSASGRHHPPVLVPVGGAPRELRPLDRKPERVDAPSGPPRSPPGRPRPRGEGRPGSVTPPRRPARHALDVARAPRSTETTSAYFALMSKRFASCGACARSATHSRGTIVGQPYWSRSIAVARTQPLVVAPQRITESTPWVIRIEARFVPKKPGRALLQHDRLVVARLEPRVDLDPAPADLQLAEARHLLQPEAAVLQARLEADRREDDRQPLGPGGVEQPLRRLDLPGHVGAERARRDR